MYRDNGGNNLLTYKIDSNFLNDRLFKSVLKNILIFVRTTLIISKKPGNTGISRDIRTEFTTDLLLSD